MQQTAGQPARHGRSHNAQCAENETEIKKREDLKKEIQIPVKSVNTINWLPLEALGF